MPTYEYECEKCGLTFEEYQRITEPPLKQCRKPGCGGTVRRLISAGAGFLFKGSGFYGTDYRSDSYKKQAKSDSSSGSSASSPASSTPPLGSSASSPGSASSTPSSDSSKKS